VVNTPVRNILTTTLAALLAVALPAAGQTPAPPGQGGTMQMPMPPAHHASEAGPLGLTAARDGSGTSWLPDESMEHGVMRHAGGWMLMAHGQAFVQFIDAGTDRGDHQFGSVNWIMGTAERSVRGGQLQLRAMLSAEPATVGRCGYPSLLQSGEACHGEALHDRQHPHDVFMELAADYRRALSSSLAFEIYAGAAGDPALGPTAFAHRPSAMSNPIGPISHHWLDSTHISFGVVTGGFYGRTWKAEASVFNGREPDDTRWTVDLAALDSYSARLSLMPSRRWVVQISAGHLAEAEVHVDGSREDVDRITASTTYHRLIGGRLWATTAAWGQNREGGQATNAFLAETSADLTLRNALFARVDLVQKTAADLAVTAMGDQTFVVQKYQAGYTRWLGRAWHLDTGVGASAGLVAVPQSLEPAYGRRVGGEFAIFLHVRTTRHE